MKKKLEQIEKNLTKEIEKVEFVNKPEINVSLSYNEKDNNVIIDLNLDFIIHSEWSGSFVENTEVYIETPKNVNPKDNPWLFEEYIDTIKKLINNFTWDINLEFVNNPNEYQVSNDLENLNLYTK